MSVVIGSRLNKPMVATFTPTEFGSRDPGVGINIRLDQGQAFVFRGIYASFVFTFPDEYDRVSLFRVHGFENKELQYEIAAGTSILEQNPSQNYIYRFDHSFTTAPDFGAINSNRVDEYFSTPILYQGYGNISFAADLRRGGNVGPIVGPMEIYLEVIGEVVNANDVEFPWKFR
jgi:hypothetical protein